MANIMNGLPTRPGAVAPESEIAPETMEETGEESGLSEEEMRSNLSATQEDIANKSRALNAEIHIDANKLKQVKSQIFKSLFDALKQLGVDPTNIDSVRGFIEEMQSVDPGLLELFADAFDALAGSESGISGMEEGASPAGGMTLPQRPGGMPMGGMPGGMMGGMPGGIPTRPGMEPTTEEEVPGNLGNIKAALGQ